LQVTDDSLNEAKQHASEHARPNWSAVFAVAFCVACLITVEFLPVSLLTPMAQDLGISEGLAGQSVTTTAFVAMFASLFITSMIRSTDRRYVVILFSVLLTVSCLLVSSPIALRCCWWAEPVSGWRWAASGRCPPR
jgi:DHA1 family purine ribonucleoside efflux pump-like MFS transporter